MNQSTPTKRVEQQKVDVAHSDSHISIWVVPVDIALELAAEIERVQKERDELQRQVEDLEREVTMLQLERSQAGVNQFKNEISKLRSQNAELLKDKERLDWLEKHTYNSNLGHAQDLVAAAHYWDDFTLRQAIDATKGERK